MFDSPCNSSWPCITGKTFLLHCIPAKKNIYLTFPYFMFIMLFFSCVMMFTKTKLRYTKNIKKMIINYKLLDRDKY